MFGANVCQKGYLANKFGLPKKQIVASNLGQRGYILCMRIMTYEHFMFMQDVCIEDISKEGPKHSVKFFLHASGSIAARFPYDQVL